MNRTKFQNPFLVLVSAVLMSSTAVAENIAANPYAHYDASEIGSITLGPPVNFVPAPYTDAVVQWDDQTANGFNATLEVLGGGGQGDPVYPGPLGHTFTGGGTGIDFTADPGSNGASLSLLPVGPAQDALLNFSSNGKDGVSIYMVYHADSLGGSFNADFNYLLGNSAFPNNGPFGVWMNSTGFVWADFAGSGAAFAGFVPEGGETVISFNYDATSGDWTIANSNKDGAGSGSGMGNDPAANYAGVNTPGFNDGFLAVGASTFWANFRTDGDFGEVIIYDRFIDPNSMEHANTIAALTEKWLVPEPSSFVLMVLSILSGTAVLRRGSRPSFCS